MAQLKQLSAGSSQIIGAKSPIKQNKKWIR